MYAKILHIVVCLLQLFLRYACNKEQSKALRKGKSRRGLTGTRLQELANVCTSTAIALGPSCSTPLNVKHPKCGKDKPISNASEKNLLPAKPAEIEKGMA